MTPVRPNPSRGAVIQPTTAKVVTTARPAPAALPAARTPARTSEAGTRPGPSPRPPSPSALAASGRLRPPDRAPRAEVVTNQPWQDRQPLRWRRAGHRVSDP